MFNHLRIRTVNLLISGLLGIAGVALALLLHLTINNVNSIQTSWQEYLIDRSEKARLESVLRASIGYGGMIHDFKNYILRQQDSQMDTVQAQIGSARTVIRQYRSLGTSAGEKVALEDISNMLNDYAEALFHARSLIKEGSSPEEIDQKVKVNDVPALRGLQLLQSEVGRQFNITARKNPNNIDANNVKGRVIANMRGAMGYGGMIHELKNLVLRRELSRVKILKSKLSETRFFIKTYQNLNLSEAEKISLEDITHTIDNYEKNTNKIIQLINNNSQITAVEIDQAVKVDDSVALRGFQTLDQEVASQVQLLAMDVDNKLNFLATTVPLINWTLLALIALIIGGSIWMFNTVIVIPISTTTKTMNLLAKDQVDIPILGTDYKNELGQMARALEKFKQNIIARNIAEKQVLKMANSDVLTGLDNKKRFEERINEAVNFARRHKTNIACLMIDLDKFKPVNDTHGHRAGDEVLKTISLRLTQTLRETDFVARLGGDEFAVIATSITDAESVKLPANRILDQLTLPVYFEDKRLEIGGSIGIAIFPEDGETVEDLIEHSDTALFKAKEKGRNCFKFFDPKLDQKSKKKS